MKRFFTLFLILATLLCGCSDAEFYDAVSVGASSESREDIKSAGAQYCYTTHYILSDNPYVRGYLNVLCKVELSTGIATPLCYDPACLHDGECLATRVRNYNVTDDGKYVYYLKQYGALGDDSPDQDILYVYDADTGKTTELDRCEYNTRHWVLMAFDDGVVYNKCVVTEKDEFGNELAFTNTLYKATPDGKITPLGDGNSLMLIRYGQMAYSTTEAFDSQMRRITQVSQEEGRGACYRATERPFFCWSEKEGDMNEVYLFSRGEDGAYNRCFLTERKASVVHLQSMVLMIEEPLEGEDPEMRFVIRCIDPYTGETVRKVDMKEPMQSFGIADPILISMIPADSLQGINGNYQVLSIKLGVAFEGLWELPFLLNADTGEVLPIKLADEWTE